MRTTSLVVVTLVLLVAQTGFGVAQVGISSPSTGPHFFNAVPSGTRVTLSRNGVMTGLFVFPQGTRLSVVGARVDADWLGPFQFKFSGGFELRVVPAAEVSVAETGNAVAIMSGAPIVLTGRPGVDLLIENVP